MKVFIDTNIFYKTKYDFVNSSVLNTLLSYIDNKKIELFLDEIVVDEIKKHIREKSQEIVKFQNKKIRDAEDVFSKTILKTGLLETKFEKISSIELANSIIELFNDFLKKSNATIIKNSEIKIELDKLMYKYFQIQPPFDVNQNKKNEFPDAIMIEKIINYFGNSEVHIVSNDKRFIEAFESLDNFITYSELDKLFDFITSKEKEKYELLENILKNDESEILLELIEKKIYNENIVVDGLEWDKHGMSEGYDYDDTEIMEIFDLVYELDTINNITEDYIEISLDCECFMKVVCSYDDYDNAIWDSEEKEYWLLDSGTVYEKHEPKFVVYARIPYKIVNNDIELIYNNSELEIDITLDEISRIERVFDDDEENRNKKCFQCGRIVDGSFVNNFNDKFYCEDCLTSTDEHGEYCPNCGEKKPLEKMAGTGYCMSCEIES